MPRLDRHISALFNINRKHARLMLAQGRITVDGDIATDVAQVINEFSHVTCDDKTIQANTPRYLMLNKPLGVVSATSDKHHTTVIDLLEQPYKDQLHLVGRLDFNSTGLVLLTNNGQWSRRLSEPDNKLLKRYRVTVENPLSEDYIAAFNEGMYFDYEGITTRPASLTILGDHEAEVGLVEGRYHQIKRMFGRFDNKVLSIHRFAVGELVLDSGLAPGQSRELTATELETVE
jgi:16S rRNA pseudouridine516 synthase